MREYDLFALLHEMAKRGCLNNPRIVSRMDLARGLKISPWALNKWLKEASDEGFIEKYKVGRRVYFKISGKGKDLLEKIHRELTNALNMTSILKLRGVVTRGLGEAAMYMSIPEYKEGFRRLLGYYPYPGTLNIRLDTRSIALRKELEKYQGYLIQGFYRDKRQYGSVRVFKAIINGGGKRVEGAILIIEITKHGPEILEVIAPMRLRDELNLKDGDTVEVEIWL